MNQKVIDFVKYVYSGMPQHNKDLAQKATQKRFSLTQDGKVFYCDAFAVRFCYSKDGTFSNTVLALSKLQKYDTIPFFVVLIKGNGENAIFLSNSSMIKKVSHSSQQLSEKNIRGSFNGSDIIKEYNGIKNDKDNYQELFAIHEGFAWNENLMRLVEATSAIEPQKQKFNPDDTQKKNLFESIERAKTFISSPEFNELKEDLDNRVEHKAAEIAIAAHIENVNIRGRLIEALIVDDNENIKIDLVELEKRLPVYDAKNGLGDYVRRFANGQTYTDIKTKILYLNSNPKAYNIDKFLECMSENDSVFLFYLIGIDENGVTNSALCPVYDKNILDATILQYHWAGRSTRGVAQLKGSTLHGILCQTETEHHIDSDNCKKFLEELLKR